MRFTLLLWLFKKRSRKIKKCFRVFCGRVIQEYFNCVYREVLGVFHHCSKGASEKFRGYFRKFQDCFKGVFQNMKHFTGYLWLTNYTWDNTDWIVKFCRFLTFKEGERFITWWNQSSGSKIRANLSATKESRQNGEKFERQKKVRIAGKSNFFPLKLFSSIFS